MKNLFKITLLSFAALIAAPAIAQDTKSSTVEAFPVGKAPEVQVGQTYVVKQEGDWQIRCVKVEEGPEPCHMYQLVKDSEGNPVAEMNISHLPGGGAAVAGANVITPLGTLLLNQMIFKIDENEGKAYASTEACHNFSALLITGKICSQSH